MHLGLMGVLRLSAFERPIPSPDFGRLIGRNGDDPHRASTWAGTPSSVYFPPGIVPPSRTLSAFAARNTPNAPFSLCSPVACRAQR